jgi:hypothetical protein
MPTDLENWHKAFEMIGPEMLRLRMEMRRGEYDGAYGRAAEEWLLKKKAESDRLEAARFRTIKRWAVIAAIAGIVAPAKAGDSPAGVFVVATTRSSASLIARHGDVYRCRAAVKSGMHLSARFERRVMGLRDIDAFAGFWIAPGGRAGSSQ